jgi:esterase
MLLNFLTRGEGPSLILIHGLFGSASNLGMVARGLATDFTVYSLDVRNHGESPHCNTMSYEEMAGDVIEFMDQQKIESCPLLGHSMGGKIAMQVAINHPQRVQRLIVADVAPVTYPSHHQGTLAGLKAVEDDVITSRNQADELLARTIPEAGVRAFLLKSLKRDEEGEFHWQLNRAVIEAEYEQLGSANRGSQYLGEVLFIKGGSSDYILPEHQDAVNALFPNASLKVIDGTGHWLHAEKPTIFNKLVLRFLLG